jgi:osmotically-inducible protein OsmY
MRKIHISRFLITSLFALGSLLIALGKSPAQVNNAIPTPSAAASPIGNPSGVINPSVFTGSGFFGRAAYFPGPPSTGNNNSTGAGSIQNSSIRASNIQNSSIALSKIQNSSNTPGVAATGTLQNQGAGNNAIAAPGSPSTVISLGGDFPSSVPNPNAVNQANGNQPVDQSFNSVPALEVRTVDISEPTTEQNAVRGLRAGVQRILSLSRLPSKNTIQVATDGRTVVLRGIVKDEQELRLAEAVARLSLITVLENNLYGAELRLTGHAGEVWSVSVSSDGKRLLTSSFDKTLRLWDADTGKE